MSGLPGTREARVGRDYASPGSGRSGRRRYAPASRGQPQDEDPSTRANVCTSRRMRLLVFSKMAGEGNGNRKWSVMNTAICPEV